MPLLESECKTGSLENYDKKDSVASIRIRNGCIVGLGSSMTMFLVDHRDNIDHIDLQNEKALLSPSSCITGEYG